MGSSPVQTALIKKLCVVKLEQIPMFSTSEKLSSEMEGFFYLSIWQHIGNKSYVFHLNNKKLKLYMQYYPKHRGLAKENGLSQPP